MHTSTPSLPPLPAVARHQLGRVLAWFFIVGFTLLVAWRVLIESQISVKPDTAKPGSAAITAQEIMAGKMLVSFQQFMPPVDQQRQLDEIAVLATSPDARLRQRILKAALTAKPFPLDTLMEDTSAEDRDVLTAWAKGEPAVPEASAAFHKKHGWYAQLAQTLQPFPDAAVASTLATQSQKFLLTTGFVGFCFFGLLLGGVGLLIYFLATRLSTSQPIGWVGPPSDRGGPFLEGFAWYLFGMVAVAEILDLLHLEISRLPFIGFFLLLGIFWPKLRGLSWAEWRWNLGLHCGKGVFREFFIGLAAWVAALPILMITATIALVISKVTGLTVDHPINEMLAADGGKWKLFLLAAVYAPITEEICFRGLLLAGLRSRYTFLISTLITSLIFALLHPQGIAAVITLGWSAFVFAYLRSWRSSVIAPISAHAINNGLACLAMVSFL